MTPKFSIIIPVYNVAPYLRECLDSVLAQTYTDWEAICVDDGSMDGSGAILDEYAKADSRFRVVHQKNAGPSAARNVGLGLTIGDWVSFVDADDYVDADYLSFFGAQKEKADVNFFDLESFFSDGRKERYDKATCGMSAINGSKAKMLYERAFSNGLDTFGWTCNKFIRRSILQDARFDVLLDCFEDEVFSLEVCARAGTFQFLSFCPYHYRMAADSLTHRRHNTRALEDAFNKFAEKSSNKYLRAIAKRRALSLAASHREFPLVAMRYAYEFCHATELGCSELAREYRFQLLKQYVKADMGLLKPLRKFYRFLRHSGEFERREVL